jgi:hypothetical protein
VDSTPSRVRECLKRRFRADFSIKDLLSSATVITGVPRLLLYAPHMGLMMLSPRGWAYADIP